MSLGPWEILLVVLVIIILFGGKKIPELACGLAKGLKEFRKTIKGLKDEVNSTAEDVKSAVDETKE
jgi:sec-independent protein translocase protein TatA